MDDPPDAYAALRARCDAEGIRLLGWENSRLWSDGVVYLLRATMPDGSTRTALSLSPAGAADLLESSFADRDSWGRI